MIQRETTTVEVALPTPDGLQDLYTVWVQTEWDDGPLERGEARQVEHEIEVLNVEFADGTIATVTGMRGPKVYQIKRLAIERVTEEALAAGEVQP